jgi:hypothetical protein
MARRNVAVPKPYPYEFRDVVRFARNREFGLTIDYYRTPTDFVVHHLDPVTARPTSSADR